MAVWLWVGALLLSVRAASPVSPARVGQDEARAWLNWLIPLPKEIQIERQVVVEADQVRVHLRPGAGERERRAAAGLVAFLGARDGEGDGAFEILLGTLDDQGRVGEVALPEVAARLRGLPNSEQAYAIRPMGDHGLVLAGLDERGVLCAALTLRQLLEGRLRQGEVAIPLAPVTDWPDLAQRGMWEDAFTAEQVEWMAGHKLNLVDCEAGLGMTGDGRGAIARLPVKGPEVLDGADYPTFCWQRGVEFAPIILHFDLLERTGLYEKYPELRGQGVPDRARLISPCARRPEFARVLADWMEELAGRPHVEEIAVWLSEEKGQCECAECRAVGQHAMEARAVASAYRQARERFPRLRVRVLLTQGSFPTNDRVLAELPPEIGVVYYHGIKTYDSSRDPMVYFALRQAAAQGRLVGVCPQLTVSWAVVCPWSCPQFVRARMTEFADKGVGLLSGYATPDIRLYGFNVAAAAEWGWNARGRDERSFALAWATRQRMKDPQAAADWAVLLGPVGWDVYGGLVPYHFIPQWGLAARMVESRVRPILGEDLFRYFPTRAHFDQDLAVCDQALQLARGLEEPALVEETLVIQGYIRMVQEIYEIADRVWRKDVPLPAAELGQHLTGLCQASRETNEALRRWERLFGEGSGGSRFAGTLELSEKVTAGIGSALDSLGVEAGEGRQR